MFLAVACFFQFLLGRRYIVENSGYSDIYDKSPLKPLRDLPYALALLDQCQVGGELENEKIRKRTHFQSNTEMKHLHITCKGGHKHLHLRGKGRAASSAQYPEGECRRIMQDGLIPPEDPILSLIHI